MSLRKLIVACIITGAIAVSVARMMWEWGIAYTIPLAIIAVGWGVAEVVWPGRPSREFYITNPIVIPKQRGSKDSDDNSHT